MSLSTARRLGLHPAFSVGHLIDLCALVFSATKWDAQGCGNGVSSLTPGTKQSAWPVASLMGVFAAAATFSIVTVFRVEKLSLRPTGSHPLCEEGSWRETLGGGLPEAEFPGLSPGILSCQPWGDKRPALPCLPSFRGRAPSWGPQGPVGVIAADTRSVGPQGPGQSGKGLWPSLAHSRLLRGWPEARVPEGRREPFKETFLCFKKKK